MKCHEIVITIVKKNFHPILTFSWAATGSKEIFLLSLVEQEY